MARPTLPPRQQTSTPSMKRIVVSFFIAVIAVVLLIFYYTLPRAVVTIETEPSNEVMEAVLNVSDPASANGILGIISQTELSQTKNFSASAAGEKEDKASGMVTLINNTNSGQSLIATTRLLSTQGILFRLQKTITVPAGGKVTAPVIADLAGEASAIPATKFTLPGLRASLREKIYAESSEPMRRAEKPGNKVTELDLEQAKKTLTDALVPQILSKLREQLPADKKTLTVAYTTETPKSESTVPAGTAKSNFDYTVTIKVTAVFYDSTTLREKALAKLQNDETLGRKILTLEEQSLAVSVGDLASDLKSATLKLKFLAQVTVTNLEMMFKKIDLLGRTPAEVKNYFSNMPGVKNVETKLSPFWVKSVPTLESHVILQTKQ
jgi:hypothetical protein